MSQHTTSTQTLSAFAGDMKNLKLALELLSSALPERTSARRVTAFVALAHHVTMGHEITLSELAESMGLDREGKPVLGAAYDRVLDPFRGPTKRDPDALDWVTTEEDPDDRRKKYLRLTKEGQKVVHLLASIIGGHT